jgi:hypothetical protein
MYFEAPAINFLSNKTKKWKRKMYFEALKFTFCQPKLKNQSINCILKPPQFNSKKPKCVFAFVYRRGRKNEAKESERVQDHGEREGPRGTAMVAKTMAVARKSDTNNQSEREKTDMGFKNLKLLKHKVSELLYTVKQRLRRTNFRD